MTILIPFASYVFSDHQAGGETRVVWGIVKELSRRGHALIVLAPRCDVLQKLPNVTVLEIGGYLFDADADFLGYKLNWWLYSLRSYWRARHIMATRPVDVVHHIRPAYLKRFSLTAFLPVPFVYGPITPVWEGGPEGDVVVAGRGRIPWRGLAVRVLRVLEKVCVPFLWRQTLSRASCVLAQIPKATKGLPTPVVGKAHLVGLATDVRVFRPSNTSPERPTVLFLAKLHRRKGLEYLLHAFTSVTRAVPLARLQVVGDGPARGFFETLAHSLGLAEVVEFVGHVPHGDTVECYQSASVYCLPSVGEPAANTLLEAMACGLPIVATAAGGMPEIVDDGKGAILVAPRDAQGLSDALCALLTNPSLSKSMGTHNRRTSEERHDIVHLVDRIERIYVTVCHPAERNESRSSNASATPLGGGILK